MIQLIATKLIERKARMDERGASAVEYGLLVAGIAALIVAVVFFFGGFVGDIFGDTCATINADGTATEGTDASCDQTP
ncbi:Flp family type IVb pilin [Nocardioides perillae]|uniref:Pilus assembly protein Flp/PilA n=1 Tax=Nocardioides perillae TaxID=1119534 RepID=A0A7Y9UVB3_9ACTN|nr:Flp family type IVb pilin [Nocardioides perillae]NYG56295.1 pilus assembly protein Flp/PilA [Nocardioides perillae]